MNSGRDRRPRRSEEDLGRPGGPTLPVFRKKIPSQLLLRFESRNRGMTLIEVALAVAILSILAGVVLPFQSLMERRAREMVLRETLREIRRAIDLYRDHHSKIDSGPTKITFKLVYPPTWENLTQAAYLRRVPSDPMTQEALWKIIPFPGFQAENGQVGEPGGIFDVRSLSEETAIDGSRYDEW